MLPFQRQPIVAALTLMLFEWSNPCSSRGRRREPRRISRARRRVFSCHTVAGGEKLAGGRALATPFGTFYSPNIAPDLWWRTTDG
jgi:hypothetical protein